MERLRNLGRAITYRGRHETSATGTTRRCWRRSTPGEPNGRAPIAASQIDTNDYNRLDVRASKAFILGGNRKVEFIAQVFNLLGRDNLGGIAQGWQDNALSDSDRKSVV